MHKNGCDSAEIPQKVEGLWSQQARLGHTSSPCHHPNHTLDFWVLCKIECFNIAGRRFACPWLLLKALGSSCSPRAKAGLSSGHGSWLAGGRGPGVSGKTLVIRLTRKIFSNCQALSWSYEGLFGWVLLGWCFFVFCFWWCFVVVVVFIFIIIISLACWVLVLILPCENNWFCETPQRTSAFSSQTYSASLSCSAPQPCSCSTALLLHNPQRSIPQRADRHCCHCPALREKRHCQKVGVFFTPLGAFVGHFTLYVEGNKGDELTCVYIINFYMA